VNEPSALRVGILQRVLPDYRLPFFDALAEALPGGLCIFAGEALPKENIQAVQSPETAGLEEAQNHYLGSPGSPFFTCWQGGLLRWLDSWQPEVLIVEANPRLLSTRLAVRWMHHQQRKVIGWGLGAPPFNRDPGGFRQRERRSFLHSLDGWIAYSRRGAEEYQRLGLPAEKIWVAHNAAARRPTSSPPERPAVFSYQPLVLFVGRLQRRKRIDLLLQACSQLPTAIQPRLCIVGDGPAREVWAALADQIYPNTEFTGARYGSSLDEIFAQADLFVLPGTGGLAIQQALAHGLPVIVAQGDGTQDDLVHLENGWLVEEGDVKALAGALQAALSNITQLRKMGTESYRIAVEEINLEAMVEVFIQAIRGVRGENM
jgi:glycosyltransferase involved in cell wall biosynthesis